MNTILVDDERWGLERFRVECGYVPEIEVVGEFNNPQKALELAQQQKIDLALLDIMMPGMNGMDLADKMRELYPDIIIIFVSAYEEYFKEAIKVRKADYFLLKPYSSEEVSEVLERAKLLSARQKDKVRIHTFGNFEVFVNDKPLKFTSEKAKELLAILVDKCGESVSTEEAFSIMWENIPYSHTEAGRYRKTLQKLQNTLIENGIENILSYFPHGRAVAKDMVSCDYYDFLSEKESAIKEYRGEYMKQYSWGEEKIFMLNRIAEQKIPEAKEYLYL